MRFFVDISPDNAASRIETAISGTPQDPVIVPSALSGSPLYGVEREGVYHVSLVYAPQSAFHCRAIIRIESQAGESEIRVRFRRGALLGAVYCLMAGVGFCGYAFFDAADVFEANLIIGFVLGMFGVPLLIGGIRDRRTLGRQIASLFPEARSAA